MPMIPANEFKKIFAEFFEVDLKQFSKEQLENIDNSVLRGAAELQALREMPKDFQNEYRRLNFGDMLETHAQPNAPKIPAPIAQTQVKDTPQALESSENEVKSALSNVFEALFYLIMFIVCAGILFGILGLKVYGTKYLTNRASEANTPLINPAQTPSPLKRVKSI